MSDAQALRAHGRPDGRIYAVNPAGHLVQLADGQVALPPGFHLATQEELEDALEAAQEAGAHELELEAFRAAANAARAGALEMLARHPEPAPALPFKTLGPDEPSAGEHAADAIRTPHE